MKKIKYVALNYDKFNFPFTAFTSGFLQVFVILLIESCNLWLLTHMTEVLSQIMNYVALGCLAGFDNAWFAPF